MESIEECALICLPSCEDLVALRNIWLHTRHKEGKGLGGRRRNCWFETRREVGFVAPTPHHLLISIA